MFRSETMNYYNIIFARENAFTVLEGLGSLGAIQIEDSQPLQNDLERPYSNQLLNNKFNMNLVQELEILLNEENISLREQKISTDDIH